MDELNEPEAPEGASDRRVALRSILIGLACGVAFGLFFRALAGTAGQGVMTLTFVCVVPIGMGFATIYPHERSTIWQALFLPWCGCALALGITLVIGWEGLICLILLAPLMLVLSSAGGLLAHVMHRSSLRRGAGALLLLPFATGPLEQRFEAPVDVRRVETAIEIAATPDVVWAQIASVPEIQPEEESFALYRAMGFPRPLSAVIDRAGVGGVREARFDGGVLFLEVVTDWQPGRRLAFTIDAQEHLIPPTTLDEHVTIGGPYFDVLTGTYEIEALPGGGVILHLASEMRVSTTFNVYAGWWADLVMASIQDQILAIVAARSERVAAAGGTR